MKKILLSTVLSLGLTGCVYSGEGGYGDTGYGYAYGNGDGRIAAPWQRALARARKVLRR